MALGLLALMATEQQQLSPAEDGSERRAMLGPSRLEFGRMQ